MEDKVIGLIKQLEAASKQVEELAEEERAASRASTSARNKLNDLQRSFDAIIKEMKSGAPRDSDWKREWTGTAPAEE